MRRLRSAATLVTTPTWPTLRTRTESDTVSLPSSIDGRWLPISYTWDTFSISSVQCERRFLSRFSHCNFRVTRTSVRVPLKLQCFCHLSHTVTLGITRTSVNVRSHVWDCRVARISR